MKKTKFVLTAAIGLAVFGLLFTGCNNNNKEEPVSQMKVEKSVETKEEAEAVLTGVLTEYADFLNSLNAPASRAAHNGKEAGKQLSNFTDKLIDFITNNSKDVSKVMAGEVPEKDLSFVAGIDFEHITPSEILETIYYYAADLSESDATYEEFVKECGLSEALKELEVTDKYIVLTKLKVALEASCKKNSKTIGASADTEIGVKISNIDSLLTELIKASGNELDKDTKVPTSLKSISVKNKAKVSASVNGSMNKNTIKNSAKATVEENLEVKLEIETEEGKGGCFVITPKVEAKAEAGISDFTSASANAFTIAEVEVKVYNNNKETCSIVYTKAEVEAFAEANAIALDTIKATSSAAAQAEVKVFAGVADDVKDLLFSAAMSALIGGTLPPTGDFGFDF